MSLSSLLKNQTIDIDNHHCGQPIAWEHNLHLHKRPNKTEDELPRSSVDCIISFVYNSSDPIKFINAKKERVENEKLKQEIRDAFKDPNIRMNFINSFYNAIAPLLNNRKRKDKDIARIARRAAKRIAKAFGLSAYIIEEIEMLSRHFYIYKFKCKCYVAVDYMEKRILAGDNINDIKEAADIINIR